MLDIRLIREKPDFVRERLATRGGGDEAKIDEVLRVDAERRQMETALQQLNADRKRLSKEIGGKKSRSEPTDELEQRVREIGDQIADLNARAAAAETALNNLLLQIANLPHESVPIGKDPRANRVVRSWGEKPRLTDPADHVALGAKLKLFDLERKKPVAVFASPDAWPGNLAFSADGSILVQGAPEGIRLWKLTFVKTASN